MSYSVYFKYGSKKYKLPVNPEELKRSGELNIETYQILEGGQVCIPSFCALEEYTFEAEFPSREMCYMEPGSKADADHYEKMFRKAQKDKKPIRFICSNGVNDDISCEVLVKSVESVEKAGEEGDKYLSLTLLEYKGAGKRYAAVRGPDAMVKQEVVTPAENPAVTSSKTCISTQTLL